MDIVELVPMTDEQSRLRLPLDTIEATRKSLSRIMRLRLRNQIDRETFRDLVYAFSALNTTWKLQVAEDFEQRLADLEAKLNMKEAPR